MRKTRENKPRHTYLSPPRSAASQRFRLGACVGIVAVTTTASCCAVHVAMVNLWEGWCRS